MNGFASMIPKMLCTKSKEMGHRIYQLSGTANSAGVGQIGCAAQLADFMPHFLGFHAKHFWNP